MTRLRRLTPTICAFHLGFSLATGGAPYPYQVRLAEGSSLPTLLKAPTGSGKTEAAVLAWLWRWQEHAGESIHRKTPRRLVYCLPMRTLVEQTVGRVEGWISNLGLESQVGVVALMGGEPRTQWYLHPEKPFIVVGTQDMLLSRALNRGYGKQPLHVAGRIRPPEQRLSLGHG